MTKTILASQIQEIGEPPSCTPQIDILPKELNLFPIGEHTKEFKDIYYPDVSMADWNSWRWQVKNRLTTIEELQKTIKLADEELQSFNDTKQLLPFAVTPYYLSIAGKKDSVLRKTFIPSSKEHVISENEEQDPLCEDNYSPVPCIVHKYPYKVLFTVTNYCSVFCRFCTRSRIIKKNDKYSFNFKDWENAIQYIKDHKEVVDVVLSGGDPLSLPNDKLEWLLQQLSSINHVQIKRIGTKMVTVLPQRIDDELVSVLKKYLPLYVNIHFTHPDELTPEVKKACELLSNNGIVLSSQTVLLKGVNNDITIMRQLMQQLLTFRVRPMYLYHMDMIQGGDHFRTSVEEGINIMRNLHGYISGMALPKYIIDSKKGKVPVDIGYTQLVSKNHYTLQGYQGDAIEYIG